MITQSVRRKNDKVEIKFEINKELECKQLLQLKLEGNYNILNNNNNNTNSVETIVKMAVMLLDNKNNNK